MKAMIKKGDETTEYFFEEGCFIVEMSNTADDPAVSIARARVEAGSATRWHRLTGIGERYVILTGTGTVEIGEEVSRNVSPGDVVIIPPGRPQRIINEGLTDLTFLAICTPRFTKDAYVDMGDLR